ncbi:MAG: DegT/DnrJ/EryC1/StrS family aminotransferase, partial [Acidimicrobiales bacterium]
DLGAQHRPLRVRLDAAIAAVVERGQFVAGPEVGCFEQRWASYCEVDHAVGCSSGTSALTLALRALGIGPGDEVVTTALTFVATVESIVECGAVPALADVDPDTGLVTPATVEAAITPRTAAVVVVHLWGQMADMAAFRALGRRHGIAVVEDAAQAHGARWDGVRAGGAGQVAAFSFFPGKNLGAFGDAGAVTSNDAGIAEKVRKLRDHGRVDKYVHDELGTNARLDTIQAAVLDVKLDHLEDWNGRRRANAAAYDEAFAGVEGVDPIVVRPAALPVWHQYVVRVPRRDDAAARLRDAGIASGIHYPIPLSRQPALAGVVAPGAFPAADGLAASILSLPVYPELHDDARRRVVEVLASHAALAPAG